MIVLILAVPLTVPANAACTIFRPRDYIYRTVYDGNNATIYYHFDSDGYISLKEKNSGNVTNTYGNAYVEPLKEYETYTFRIYPLGSSFVPGRDMEDNAFVVDVSDFKSEAVFELSCGFDVNLAYAYTGLSAGDTTLSFDNSGYVCFYDKNGHFLSNVSVQGYKTDILIPDQGPISSGNYAHLFNYSIPLKVPEGAAYLMPCLVSSFTTPDYHSPHTITAINVSSDAFIMTANKNLLIEQSETLKAVEEKLGDLNDKADTIINGTQEQQQDGQNAVDKSEEQDREFDEIMEQLEDYEKIDTSSISSVIQDFVYTDGWLYIKDLLSPVLNWNPYIVTMLVVLALVNLSVILFGR